MLDELLYARYKAGTAHRLCVQGCTGGAKPGGCVYGTQPGLDMAGMLVAKLLKQVPTSNGAPCLHL